MADDVKLCSIEPCGRLRYSREWCQTHYRRWRDHGDPLHGGPLRPMPPIGPCQVADCGGAGIRRGYCFNHYMRLRRRGTTDAARVYGFRVPGEPGRLTNRGDGYQGRYFPEHPNTGKDGMISEHVHVMSAHLGRAMRQGESVHHRNGNRRDNRIENLELWTTAHPAGQRVTDLVAWAREVLDTYEIEASERL